MKPEEMIKQCDRQMELIGPDANVMFVMPGKWGKRDTKRLFPGGPIGKITHEFDGAPYGHKRSVYVMFKAQEVKDAMTLAMLEEDAE